MAEILGKAHDLATLICQSDVMDHYMSCKKALENDKEAQKKISDFQIKKEQYEEVQRFGRWHPDYQRVTRETREFKRELDSMEVIARFKKAEFELEKLLHSISKTIATAVSDQIKVPSDHPLLNMESAGCGCGTGGSCGCRS
ncbi:MAG: YlbF family regulator [Bacillaceae bacterium]|nr:YlbF family regulator [Bacillaceae bacterium]